jgi:dTDP-4-dehydrorhamnose reductase
VQPGQLGSELKGLSENISQFEWFFADRTQVSLDNLSPLKTIGRYSSRYYIKLWCLYCSEYVENGTKLADIVNHQAVKIVPNILMIIK